MEAPHVSRDLVREMREDPIPDSGEEDIFSVAETLITAINDGTDKYVMFGCTVALTVCDIFKRRNAVTQEGDLLSTAEMGLGACLNDLQFARTVAEQVSSIILESLRRS